MCKYIFITLFFRKSRNPMRIEGLEFDPYTGHFFSFFLLATTHDNPSDCRSSLAPIATTEIFGTIGSSGFFVVLSGSGTEMKRRVGGHLLRINGYYFSDTDRE